MARKSRKILAVVVLIISLTLLVWGLWPDRRETLIQFIEPNQIQLPTPSSFYPDFMAASGTRTCSILRS